MYGSTSSDNKDLTKSKDRRGESDIEGFLDEVMLSSSTVGMTAVIEEARKALLECDISSEEESPIIKAQRQPSINSQPPFKSNGNAILEEDQEGES